MTIHAFTELHSNYPAYVNLSEQKDGTIKVSVRTRGHNGSQYATIDLTAAQAEELADSIYKHVYKDEASTKAAPVAEGCPECGCIGLHACPGSPMKEWTPEEVTKLNSVLAEYAPVPVAEAPTEPDCVDQFLIDNLKLWKDEGMPAPMNELQSIAAWLRCLGNFGEKETGSRMRTRMALLMKASNELADLGEETVKAAGIYDRRLIENSAAPATEQVRESVAQQAQQWALEAKTQRATVLSILRHLGLPENDWEALSLIQAAQASPAKPDLAGLTILYKELGQIKWMGSDAGWDLAIDAVRKRVEALLAAITKEQK